MIGLLRNWRRRRILKRSTLAPDLWTPTVDALPILDFLDAGSTERLRQLTILFSHEKRFDAVGDCVLDDRDRVLIAAQAVLPILNLGIDWYNGWTTLIVYPAEFVAPREERDESGVVHSYHQVMSGESWQHGPVVLSMEDVNVSGRCDGYNVVIHEMAHKLDMLDGGPNGCPPLHRGMNRARWAEAFTAAYRDLQRRVDTGEDTPIDPYAAEDPAECFAIFSEYFFEMPELLVDRYPDAYRQLVQFYRQDPERRRRH